MAVVRRIELPRIDWSTVPGAAIEIPVKVDWPELQLTEDQIAANAAAWWRQEDEPYSDHSIFSVVIPRPKEAI